MDAIGERLDPAREFVRVRDEVPLPVALRRHPPIVDDDVAVSGIAHPRRDHRLGGLDHQAFVDLHSETIPAVPTHRRCRRETVGETSDPHYGTTAMRRPRPYLSRTQAARSFAPPRRPSAMMLPPKPPPTRRAPRAPAVP